MIFSDKERKYWGIKTYDHSYHRFIDESAWPICEFAREFINKWSILLPADNELISRLKSKSDKQFNSAIFELLIFALFKKQNFDIKRNPASQIASTDFTLFIEDQKKILMECTLAASALESVEENRKKESVMRFVEELDDFPFYVSINFNRLSDHSLPKKKFVSYLRSVVKGYNIGALSNKYFYEDAGWILEIRFMRKPESAHKRIRGVTGNQIKIIDNFTPLFSALNDKKPSKYNLNNLPYVICLGLDDMSVVETEISDVLFGPNNLNNISLSAMSSGILVNKGQPINTSISGVLYSNHLHLFALHMARVSLWHNPFSTKKLPTNVFPFNEYIYQVNGAQLRRTIINEGPDMLTLLEINKEKYLDSLEFRNKVPPTERD
jgi:hypothetical protein